MGPRIIDFPVAYPQGGCVCLIYTPIFTSSFRTRPSRPFGFKRKKSRSSEYVDVPSALWREMHIGLPAAFITNKHVCIFFTDTLRRQEMHMNWNAVGALLQSHAIVCSGNADDRAASSCIAKDRCCQQAHAESLVASAS